MVILNNGNGIEDIENQTESFRTPRAKRKSQIGTSRVVASLEEVPPQWVVCTACMVQGGSIPFGLP